MSITVLTTEEVAERNELNFRFIEAGFMVEFINVRSPVDVRRALVAEKDESKQTLQVVLLTQENIFSLLGGKRLLKETISKSSILNVFATAVTDTMCREREEFYAHCAHCKKSVYQWPGKRQGTQNYRVGQDGLCRHLDCSDIQKSESSP